MNKILHSPKSIHSAGLACYVWINAEDKLPNQGKEVLVFSRAYGKVIAYIDNEGKWCARDADYETGEPWLWDDDAKVTHWTELPADPMSGD
jgi:hypothetical protein